MAKKKNNRADMPKPTSIYNYWRKKLFEQYGRELPHKNTCFACLREGSVQRCHITALSNGGSNKSGNLHLLCPNCHSESEGYEGRFYWVWFENKDIVFLPLYRNIERGMLIAKFAALIKEKMPNEYLKVLKSDNPKDMVNLYDRFMEMYAKQKLQPPNQNSTLF